MEKIGPQSCGGCVVVVVRRSCGAESLYDRVVHFASTEEGRHRRNSGWGKGNVNILFYFIQKKLKK